MADTGNGWTPPAAAEAPKAEAAEPKQRGLDVVYVSDIDLMMPAFLRIRARPGEDEEISWQFENVNFLLNIIDVLSGDDDYIEIRKRKPKHSTLRIVEVGAQEARQTEFRERITYQEEFDKAVKAIEEENAKEIDKFQKELEELQAKQTRGGTGRHSVLGLAEPSPEAGRSSRAFETPTGCETRADAASAGREDRGDPPQSRLGNFGDQELVQVLSGGAAAHPAAAGRLDRICPAPPA
jgi:hypothetical protein